MLRACLIAGCGAAHAGPGRGWAVVYGGLLSPPRPSGGVVVLAGPRLDGEGQGK
jgi:hypothetical protein